MPQACFSLLPLLIRMRKEGNRQYGGIAQLARASALQAEGLGFESPCLQEIFERIALGIERIIWSSEKGSTEDA